ncbi:Pseudouridylate synthase 7 -like protein [Halotydeus destructor]|nr:Pseudouridylate synthase 7 -like protein [Halotydeus destructor]
MASLAKKAKTDDNEPDLETEEEPAKEEVASIREADVGITEYLSTHKGFFGLLKQRYSDFVVHEVRMNGEEVRLTNMDLPEKPVDPKLADLPDLKTLISEEECVKLRELEDVKNGSVEIDVTELDKDTRTRIHKVISQEFQGFNTKTIDKDSKKYIIASRGKQERGDNRGTWPYPGDFTCFSVYMENRGTSEVVNTISRTLNYNQKGFGYAGSKDKRAIAVQRMSLFRTEPKKILKVNDVYMNNPNPIAVGDFSFEKNPLKLGQLSGNVFDIILREAKFDTREDVSEAFTALSNHGFINYFGTQRFGSGHVRTQEIGLAILRQDWEKAVNFILSPTFRDKRAKDRPTFNECMKLYQETKNASNVFKKFHWKNSNEGQLLENLSKKPTNFYAALASLPRNNRSLYMHAYQSLIWNQAASQRIRKHGLKVLPGDLLFFDEEVASDLEPDEGDGRREPVIADETNMERATILDVVLPLPGTKVTLPVNETGDVIKEILDKDEVSLEKFGSKAKDFMFYGAYRKLICKPKKLDWSLVKYEDEKQRLIQTDLELVQHMEPEVSSGGSFDAVKLSVSLPSSSYATVFIRELMKQDISTVWLNK